MTSCDVIIPFDFMEDIVDGGFDIGFNDILDIEDVPNVSTRETEHEHTWNSATCTRPKTCADCGETSGSASGHSWEEATCMSPKTCSECGETDGSTSGHSWKAATCMSPKTCSVCGETSGSTSSTHSWKSATCTKPQTCSVCGETNGIPAGHTWSGKTCNKCNTTVGMYSGTRAPDFGYALKTYMSPTLSSSTSDAMAYYYSFAMLNGNGETSDCLYVYSNLLSACGYTYQDSIETDGGDTMLMYINSSMNGVAFYASTESGSEGIVVIYLP